MKVRWCKLTARTVATRRSKGRVFQMAFGRTTDCFTTSHNQLKLVQASFISSLLSWPSFPSPSAKSACAPLAAG